MRGPELNRDYGLVTVYRCMICHNFIADFTMDMVKHIQEEHEEDLK